MAADTSFLVRVTAPWRPGAILLVIVSLALGSQRGAAAAPVITLDPACGPLREEPYTISVVGTGLRPGRFENLSYVDANGGIANPEIRADDSGTLRAEITVGGNEGNTLISVGSAAATFMVPCPVSGTTPEPSTPPTPPGPITLVTATPGQLPVGTGTGIGTGVTVTTERPPPRPSIPVEPPALETSTVPSTTAATTAPGTASPPVVTAPTTTLAPTRAPTSARARKEGRRRQSSLR